MGNQNPANRTLRRLHSLRLIGGGVLAWCFLFSVFLFPPCVTFAQTGRVIIGAERLYVRRGAGAEFPPFATLTKGDTVEVQEIQGEWARIVTGGGQTGYVRSAFLVLPGERKKGATPPPVLPTPTAKPAAKTTAKPTPTPKPPRAATPEPVALRTANAQNQALEAQVRDLQREIQEMKRRGAVANAAETSTPATLLRTPLMTASPTPTLELPAAASTDPAQSEIARLTALVETLQHRAQARPPIEGLPAPALPSEGAPSSSSSGLILGVVGVAIGWAAGSTLGRRSERGRRPRVRF